MSDGWLAPEKPPFTCAGRRTGHRLSSHTAAPGSSCCVRRAEARPPATAHKKAARRRPLVALLRKDVALLLGAADLDGSTCGRALGPRPAPTGQHAHAARTTRVHSARRGTAARAGCRLTLQVGGDIPLLRILLCDMARAAAAPATRLPGEAQCTRQASLRATRGRATWAHATSFQFGFDRQAARLRATLSALGLAQAQAAPRVVQAVAAALRLAKCRGKAAARTGGRVRARVPESPSARGAKENTRI